MITVWAMAAEQVGRHLPWLAPVLGAVLGAVAGSFITCASYRLPRGLSLWQPPSHCPSCKRVLGVADLVPLLSWLALRGRCRTCAASIPPTSLLHEVLAAAFGGMVGYMLGFGLFTFPLLLLMLALYSMAVLWPCRR